MNADIQINIDGDEKKHKKPPTLVYCGDGVLEEYSDEEEEAEKAKQEEEAKRKVAEAQIDTTKLDWGPWLKHYAVVSASKGLAACDFMGEKLAWWFGITQPKYLYEIEEYNRMKQEQEENDSETEEIELKINKKVVDESENCESDNKNPATLASKQLFQS